MAVTVLPVFAVLFVGTLGLVCAAAAEDYYYGVTRELCCEREQKTREKLQLETALNVVESVKSSIEQLDPTPDCLERLSLLESPGLPTMRQFFLTTNGAPRPERQKAFCFSVKMLVKLPHELKREPNLNYFMPSDFEQFSEVDEVEDFSLSVFVRRRDVLPPFKTHSEKFSRFDAEKLPDELLLNDAVEGGREADERQQQPDDKFRRAMHFMFVTAWGDDEATYKRILDTSDEVMLKHARTSLLDDGEPVAKRSKGSRKRSRTSRSRSRRRGSGSASSADDL